MKLSVVIPARDEAACIAKTIQEIKTGLTKAAIDHEIIVVDDWSGDSTASAAGMAGAAVWFTPDKPGFGRAVRCGIKAARYDVIAVVMADGSDSTEDLVRCFQVMRWHPELDCVFGSRFIAGARVYDYPWPKLVLNRIANNLISVLFGIRYNDITNAFKLYRAEVLRRDYRATDFSLLAEMPLRAICEGYSYMVLPISWRNRKNGRSKFRIKELGSAYVRVILRVWLTAVGCRLRRLPLWSR